MNLRSLLNRVPCVPACHRGLHANVLAYQHGLRANVLACQRAKSVPTSYFYVPTCLRANEPKACQLLIFTCQRVIQRAIVLFQRANVPNGVPIFQLDVPTCQFFQTFLLRSAKGNFYTLLLHKKLYILLDIIVIHIIKCIVNKNCIILQGVSKIRLSHAQRQFGR